MTESTLAIALIALGFTEGWAVSGDTITLWENTEPQPTEAQLINAGWVKSEEATDEALTTDADTGTSPD